jgi:hypothetical protein
VHNSLPISRQFFSKVFAPLQIAALHAPPRKSFADYFIGENPLKSVAKIFLNCTKNTELTARPFTRTFGLALNKIKFDPSRHNSPAQPQSVSDKLIPIKLDPSNTPRPPVILSEEFALRSKANPQSKDPFHQYPANELRRAFSSINPTRRSRDLAPTDFCEHTMNSPCGNRIHNPGIKPVIVEDTTCGVSLLTGTICGSNFAFP